jgi:hypothetical protein
MASSTLVRAISKPLIWLILIAATLLTLLALETTTTGHAPSLVPLTQVANNSSAHGNSHGSNGNTAHCTDGHGKDGQKNKHCQISGSG